MGGGVAVEGRRRGVHAACIIPRMHRYPWVHVRTWGPPSLRWGGHPAQGYAPSNRNRNEVPAGVPYFPWALGEGVSPSGYPPGEPLAPHNGIF